MNARQALFTDADGDATGAGGNFTDGGLPPMSDRISPLSPAPP